MSDIFISYKREDQSTARFLADALEKQGWSVWWDPKLRAGERFDDVIEQALEGARCVIVLWSKRSVESKYVRDEAAYALNKDKLVPVAIDDAVPPFRFQTIQTPRLADWTKPADSQEFQNLVSDLKARLEPFRRTEEKLQAKDDERNQRVLPRSSVTTRMLRWAMAVRLNRIKVAVSISVICALAILVTTVHYPGWQKTRPEAPVGAVPESNKPASSRGAYPRDIDVSATAAATAGDYTFRVLSARLEEYGRDEPTGIKTLRLRLRVRETYNSNFALSGYFSGDGFRLVVDDTVIAPKEYPGQTIHSGTSEDGWVAFVLPENAKRVTLRVGYYDGQRTDVPLALFQ